MTAIAVDLDAVLGDARPLFKAWLRDAERRCRVDLREGDETTLDERLGNWRQLLERFAEDHAPVYLRPNPEANAVLRGLRASGVRIGAFTEVPEPLARVAAAQLGVARHLDVLEAGAGAVDRLLKRLGADAFVALTLRELTERVLELRA